MDTGVGLMQNKKRQTYQSDKKASVCSCQLNHLFIYLVKFNARVHSTIGNHADSFAKHALCHIQCNIFCNVVYISMCTVEYNPSDSFSTDTPSGNRIL